MPTSTLTTKGQLVIPKAVRAAMGLKPGDRLDFIVQDDGTVVIRPAVADVRELKGLLARNGRKPVSLEDMDRAVRAGSRRSKR